MKLFMVLIGCTPKDRFTEQHDVFFGIADKLSDLKESMQQFWNAPPLHVDAWREVTVVDEYEISIVEKSAATGRDVNLYFINLGGYKRGEFDEFHHKMLVVAPDQKTAVKKAKDTLFFKSTGFKGAAAHIDEKYGVDVDDFYNVEDILARTYKKDFSISIREASGDAMQDEVHLGYIPFTKL